MKFRLWCAAVVLLIPLSLVSAEETEIREIKSNAAVKPVPPACVKMLREFIHAVSAENPDIAADEEMQQRWLSADLQEGLNRRLDVCRQARQEGESSIADTPSNASFIGFWDPPAAYSIVGSRLYGNRAVVDVLYSWGKGSNYPGDKELVSYVLVNQKGWKLDDLYIYGGDCVQASCLSAEFRQKD